MSQLSTNQTVESAPPCAAPVSQADWFKVEVHAHDGQLKSWLRGQFPSVRSEVDDVVQESYLRIWKTKTERPILSAKSFLFTIARNLAINLLRRGKVAPMEANRDLDSLSVLDNGPTAVELLTEHEKMEVLSDALVALPARTRAIFILHKFEGLPQAVVARQLGVSEKSVEYQVARGLRLCEEFFRARGL